MKWCYDIDRNTVGYDKLSPMIVKLIAVCGKVVLQRLNDEVEV